MGGLECSEVLLSTTKERNNTFRIDSHYFEKEYLKLNKKLKQFPHWYLKDIVSKPIQTGHTPSMKTDSFYGGEIALIKTDNLHENNIGQVFSDYLSSSGNALIARTELQEDDIITTIIGATEEVIARSALVLPEHLPANINQNIAQIRVNKQIALPEYINAYLNSKFGRMYLRYLSRQTEQVNLNCQEVGLTIIPKFTKLFQQNIKICTVKANELQKHAEKLYIESESVLLSTLGMTEFMPTEKAVTIKSFSKSFGSSGRLDAEYFQKKYDRYESIIKSRSEGWTTIREKFVHIKNKCDRTLPTYKYIEIGDINVGSGSASANEIEKRYLPDNAKIITSVGDVLVSTVRPNRGAIAILDIDGCLVSGAFTVLREKSDYPKETLQVLLRSPIYRDWMLRFNVGTSYPVIKDDDVLNIPLPHISDAVNQQIAKKVRKSFELRHQSEQLLKNTKHAVEMAIELDEDRAVQWLRENGGEC